MENDAEGFNSSYSLRRWLMAHYCGLVPNVREPRMRGNSNGTHLFPNCENQYTHLATAAAPVPTALALPVQVRDSGPVHGKVSSVFKAIYGTVLQR